MTRIKRYKDINEEFIGTILKGALGKVFNLFAQPFKDLANDIKKSYKDGDPNSVKSLVIAKLNAAIDAVQKGLSDKSVDEGAVKDMMNQFLNKLTELGNGVTADFEKALGKEKSGGPAAIAKSIIMGNKEYQWGGIVGLLTSTNYKYSKANYEKMIADAGKGQTGDGSLKIKKDAAVKFFDAFQKDFVVRLQRDFSDEEIKKLFDSSGGGNKVEFEIGDQVRYKKKGYDEEEAPEVQTNMIAQGEIKSISDEQVTIFNKRINKTLIRNKSDILGKAGAEGEGPNAMKAKEVLGAIKGNEEKMSQVVKFAQFISNDNNKEKLPEIEKIIGGVK